MAIHNRGCVPDEGILAEEGILLYQAPANREWIPREEIFGHSIGVKYRRRCPMRGISFIMVAFLCCLTLYLFGLPYLFAPSPVSIQLSDLDKQRPLPTPPTVKYTKSHIPSRISNVLQQLLEGKGFTSHNVGSNHESTVIRGPRFHLLIAAKEPRPNLCKTLLSAAALNYPSPVLINYRSDGIGRQQAADIIRTTHKFLIGDDVQENDLILIAEEDNWFQLPVEVIIGRFLHGTRDSDTMLLKKYGRKPPKIDLNSPVIPIGLPRYNQKVLFGAQKDCSNSPEELACYSAPQSPILTEIYGPLPGEFPGTKLDLPRYLGPAMAMGRVADLRPIYQRAQDILEIDDQELLHSYQVLARIFGKQEQVRSVRAEALRHNPQLSTWTSLLLSPGNNLVPKMRVPSKDIDIKLGKEYEFGIGLDYTGSIFQAMSNSTTDLRFVTFKQPPTVPWPSLHPGSASENSIRLPGDLTVESPFTPPSAPSAVPSPPLHPELDRLPKDNVTWQDVDLLINIIIPSSSVPSIVNFQGNESLQDEWWHKMWYQQHARALLRQQLRNPKKGVHPKIAREGDEQWWDFRGGKGGAWTDNGTWLGWNEVCGGLEEEVFGDGLGQFGAEEGTDREDGFVV